MGRATALPLAAALLAAPGAAPAQTVGPPIDTVGGPAVASGRVMGLGGAYVAVAEGVGGAPLNPAAVAQRNARLRRTWDLDGLVTLYVPSTGRLASSDLDNDGRTDGALTGAGNVLVGGLAQAGRLGGAAVVQAWVISRDRPGGERVEASTVAVSLTAGWSAWRDALVIGGGITAAGGTVTFTPPGEAARELGYQALVYQLGTLWRPRGAPWRVGLAYQSAARPGASGDPSGLPFPAPAAFVVPWRLSGGLALWLGPNARRVNEPPPIALWRHPDWGEGPAYQASSRTPVLLSAQLDLLGRAPGAVGLDAALGEPAHASGRAASLVPRAGAEWEPIPSWLRVRGGGYLEPSRAGAGPRLHGTFGLEVKVPCWPWDLQLSAGGDLADRYRNVSLTLGLWGELAPPPPSPPAADG